MYSPSTMNFWITNCDFMFEMQRGLAEFICHCTCKLCPFYDVIFSSLLCINDWATKLRMKLIGIQNGGVCIGEDGCFEV